jgi:hypothetical protein
LFPSGQEKGAIMAKMFCDFLATPMGTQADNLLADFNHAVSLKISGR